MNIRKSGFTMAEVLITLGVVGVVAAMTLPSVINNFQVSSWETALKKSYNIITNGFHAIAAENGGDLRNSGLFDDIDRATFSDRIDEAVRKHFKVIKSCKYGDTLSCPGYNVKYLKGKISGNNTLLVLSSASLSYIAYLDNGMIFSMGNYKCKATTYPTESKLRSKCSYINVDINGKKGPNIVGKDFFQFGLMDEKGDIYPDTSLEWAKANVGADNALSYKNYWRNSSSQCGTPNEKLKNETRASIDGSNCLARIMENNWKMDYLH